jgi:hypothetical protein
MAALSLALLGACLPHRPMSGHADLPPRRARVEVAVKVLRTEGAVDLPPFERVWTITLLHRWARTFRDGSEGIHVRVEDAREGAGVRCPAPESCSPSPLTGAWWELRRFPDGRVLTLEPLAPWTGTRGALESLDVLWPFLSPRLPLMRVGKDPRDGVNDIVSVPTAPRGAPAVRTTLQLTWRHPSRERLEVEGVATGVAGLAGGFTANPAVVRDLAPVSLEGTLRAAFPDTPEAGLGIDAEGSVQRTVTTRWGTREVVQQQDWTLRVTDQGEAPERTAILRVAHAPGEPTMQADLQPLTLADGTVASQAPVAADALPFLLLPYGLSSEDLASIRAALLPETR